MMTTAGHVTLADLRDIVGPAHAREAGPGDAVDGVTPRFVVEPGAVAEVSLLMRLAHEAGLAVAPRGGGTKMGWGNPPRRLDLILSTRRLDRVLEHVAGDLVARAEAGATLGTLQETVGKAGQRLALDPPEEGATLGGIVAANPSGPSRPRYGTVRDLLIGITIVLADGTVARAGGKVVKNVAGYDLGKLFTGSMGTLGVVVETTWRLHPLPAARRTVHVSLPSAEAAGAAVQDLLGVPLVLDALELRWDGPHPRPLSRARERGVGGEGAPTLAVLFAGIEPGVAAQAETAGRLLRGRGAARTLGADEQDAYWRGAAAYPWDGGDVGLKVTHPPALLPVVLRDIAELAGAHHVAPRIAGQAATGVTLVGLCGGDAASIPALVGELRGRVARVRGSVVVLQASIDIKEGLDVWGPVGDALPLMRRVKEQFDPAGILNPGRFVGGI